MPVCEAVCATRSTSAVQASVSWERPCTQRARGPSERACRRDDRGNGQRAGRTRCVACACSAHSRRVVRCADLGRCSPRVAQGRRSKACAAAHAMFLPTSVRAVARDSKVAQPDQKSVHPTRAVRCGGRGSAALWGGRTAAVARRPSSCIPRESRVRIACLLTRRVSANGLRFGAENSVVSIGPALIRRCWLASFGDPASEGVGVDLSEFVPEGGEHLPVGIEGADPSGQFFAVWDVHGPDDALDERNLARDK